MKYEGYDVSGEDASSGRPSGGGDEDGGSAAGDEAAWRDLVANYDIPVSQDRTEAPWPDREDLTAPPASNGSPVPGTGADRARVIRPAAPPPEAASGPPVPGPTSWRGPAQADAEAAAAAESAEPEGDDAEEHYIPPPPPPLPRLDPVAKGALAATFGGPGYLLLTMLIGWSVPGWAALLAVMAFVGGFAVLVLRLGDGPSRGSGPDNGAVL